MLAIKKHLLFGEVFSLREEQLEGRYYLLFLEAVFLLAVFFLAAFFTVFFAFFLAAMCGYSPKRVKF